MEAALVVPFTTPVISKEPDRNRRQPAPVRDFWERDREPALTTESLATESKMMVILEGQHRLGACANSQVVTSKDFEAGHNFRPRLAVNDGEGVEAHLIFLGRVSP